MSKVLIVTSYPPTWSELAKITCATHKAYCDRHGYDYFADCSDVQHLVGSPWVDERPTKYAPLRTMIKFPLLAHFLDGDSCRKTYDIVAWLDADTVVTRYEQPIENYMANDLTLAYDVNGLHPTVIICRNSVLMRGLIWACGEAGLRMFQQHGWNDIMAFRFFLATPPYDALVGYLSAQSLCAMPPDTYPIPPAVRYEYEWTPDSWTLHLSALSLEKRIELATKWVEEFKLLA